MQKCQPIFSSAAWNETKETTARLVQQHNEGRLLDLDDLSLAFKAAVDEAVTHLEQYVQLFKHYLLALQLALKNAGGGLSIHFEDLSNLAAAEVVEPYGP